MEHHKYAYAVLFSQQMVEKILKAYIIEIKRKVPRKIHFLEELIKDAELDLTEIDNPDIKELSKAYAKVRYPDLSKKFFESRTETEILLVIAKTTYLWIETKLKKN
ncbi:MAG TPA: HEPN domain-containing protein [Candidatus Woesebacteria bacterium]|nr:HEPN domain-containing protein [Candidatus Woesebacteria bacterium]